MLWEESLSGLWSLAMDKMRRLCLLSSWQRMVSPTHCQVVVSITMVPLLARTGSQALQALSSQQRADILHTLAALLVEREADILAANERDLEAAAQLSPPLWSRLTLSSEKLASLTEALHQLAGLCLKLSQFQFITDDL